jgi:ATP-dependent Clp protease ATP-binding subunit ClpA
LIENWGCSALTRKEPSLYERFTDRARKVMQLANEEAIRFHHEYIGTEHILLGLIKEDTGVAACVLGNLMVDLACVRREVEKIIERGPDMEMTMTKLRPTPRAKKVLEFADEEARNLKFNRVGTEHLLLGLIREETGVAAQVLIKLGLSLPDIRDEVLHMFGEILVPQSGPTRLVVPPRIDEAIKHLDGLVELLQQMISDCANDDFDRAVQVRDERDKLRKLRDFLLRERNL